MSNVVRNFKKLAKKFPPIAWRDEKLQEFKRHNRQLRAEVVRLGGRVPKLVDGAASTVDVGSAGDQAQLVRSSGLFDADFYRSQLEPGEKVDDPVLHYVTEGFRRNLKPSTAFMEAWYKSNVGLEKTAIAGLVAYLTNPAADQSPHSMFPQKTYVQRYPQSLEHKAGPLGHYLDHTEEIAPIDGERPALLPPQDFAARARSAAQAVLASRGHGHLPRIVHHFDYEAEQRFKDELRRDDSLLVDRPLVSVVLPTKDRARPLRVAVDSVLDQTYGNFELLIVDDGSTDDTADVIGEYAAADSRVKHLRHEVNRGVAAARNTAIAAATGKYVAYLDSDNTWTPDFLEIMLRHLDREDAAVGYAASALVEEDGERRQYRAMPFSREGLRERNYIDCIVVVHEKRLLDEVGGFDESLRRTVDWDLLIRLADAATFSFAPFIGTAYDLWEDGTDRISTEVSEGYRFRVRQRTLVDFDEARRKPRGEHVSVVMVVSRPTLIVEEAVHRILASGPDSLDVVLVDNHMSEEESVRLHFMFTEVDRVQVTRLSQRLPQELARNVGATITTGKTLVFFSEAVWPHPGWLAPLIDGLRSHVAVQPRILTLGGAVWSAGVSFAAGPPTRLYTGFAGDATEVRSTSEVDAVNSICMAVDAQAFLAIDGFDPLTLRDEAGSEVSVRLRSSTGGTAACIGESVVSLRREVSGKHRTKESLHIAVERGHHERDLWVESGLTAAPVLPGYRAIGYSRPSAMHAGAEPIIVHERPQRPLRWAIKIGPEFAWERENWGDWHFATALRDALERLGHEATIDIRGSWYRSGAHLDDVVLVLQGRGRYLPQPGQLNVQWVFSHPDEAPISDAAHYDLVFGASERWCRRAAPYSRRAPEVLLQCTDPDRFHPVPHDSAVAHDVLMIGNARGVRPAVAAVLAAGIVPHVYGKKWEGLLPAGAWRGEFVPNEQLPAYYASAGVVLNDHWDEMREWGMVSNRLFDLTACGARVISDYLPQIESIFDGAVSTFTTSQDVPALVQAFQEEAEEHRRRRLALAERVRSEHSFDARAQTLSDRVAALMERTS